MGPKIAIPPKVAHELCVEIRVDKAQHLFTQCWGCVRFSDGDEARMCYNRRSDLRGCGLVSALYDARYRAAPAGA